MQVTSTIEMETSKSATLASSAMQCFTETPGKTGDDQTLTRMGAFDLFTFFTADIIRSKEVFTR